MLIEGASWQSMLNVHIIWKDVKFLVKWVHFLFFGKEKQNVADLLPLFQKCILMFYLYPIPKNVRAFTRQDCSVCQRNKSMHLRSLLGKQCCMPRTIPNCDNNNFFEVRFITWYDVLKIAEALDAGADEYIMKPFDSDILGAKFSEVGLINLVDQAA